MASRDTSDYDNKLSSALANFYADPLGYVMFDYPWRSDPSIQLVKLAPKYRDRFDCEYGPDEWACEFLDDLGREIRERGFDGRNAVIPIRFSTASGHGIGKSVLVAWLVNFIIATRPYCKGVVTATTDSQLRTKTWAEVGKWHKLSLTRNWFDYSTGRGSMTLKHKLFPENWRVDAQTSREENSESFAGLHAANSTPFYIFDEASGIPDKIYEVREGGTTDGEPMVFDFGNPTRNSGAFYENTIGKNAHRYKTRSIDSRTVAITSKSLIDQWIEDRGEDSDFVRVRVKGQFPHQGSLQFISNEMVLKAMARESFVNHHAALVIGVDVARFGDNDSVIYPRLGDDARSWPPRLHRGLDTVQLAGKVVETLIEFERLGVPCAGLFVDVGGVGGGVVDVLRNMGRNPIGVNFGGSPIDAVMYRYRGDEMWGRMKDAIKDRLILPTKQQMPQTGAEDVTLQTELTNREYGVTLKGQINLESKADMHKRGVGSPDVSDALALTYAMDVVAPSVSGQGVKAYSAKVSDFDPNDTERM